MSKKAKFNQVYKSTPKIISEMLPRYFVLSATVI